MNPELKNQIIEVAQDLLKRVGFEADIRMVDDGFSSNSFPVLLVESEKDLSMLIGKNGQNLNAFEHLVRLMVFHKNISQELKELNFVVDINDYRKSRARYILDLARSAASRVASSQKAEALVPMSSYERRLVHTELASNRDIQTESIGEEPRRRIVIKPLLI